jgi:hypothetical protein
LLSVLIVSAFLLLVMVMAAHKPPAISAWPTSDWRCEHIGDPGAVMCNRNAPPIEGLPR